MAHMLVYLRIVGDVSRHRRKADYCAAELCLTQAGFAPAGRLIWISAPLPPSRTTLTGRFHPPPPSPVRANKIAPSPQDCHSPARARGSQISLSYCIHN